MKVGWSEVVEYSYCLTVKGLSAKGFLDVG